MGTAIRQATPEDAPAIVRIYVDSWNEGFGDLMPVRSVDNPMVERWTNDLSAPAPHRWWVAETGGSIVGFVGIVPSRDPVDPVIGEVDTIAVDPGHWDKGIGRLLMDVAVKHLEADGYRQAIVWTLENYDRGRRFYEATGWKRDGGARDEGRQVRYQRSLGRPHAEWNSLSSSNREKG